MHLCNGGLGKPYIGTPALIATRQFRKIKLLKLEFNCPLLQTCRLAEAASSHLLFKGQVPARRDNADGIATDDVNERQ
jgi:hypothetical protein